MATLFISDLHIDASHPAIIRQFLSFLENEARHASALYILGDLFESWIGDDAADSAQLAAIAGLRALTSSGIPCFVMHGNRDFLLSDEFCRMSGTEILPDPLIVTLYGERILVMHGDALCTDDGSYQRLRATVRSAGWQEQFLRLTAGQRRVIAGAARTGSQAHTAAMEHAITDVNAHSVELVVRASNARTLLHGHTHRPAIHAFEVDGRACTRIVLGDWYTHGSMVRWSEDGPELVSLNRES